MGRRAAFRNSNFPRILVRPFLSPSGVETVEIAAEDCYGNVANATLPVKITIEPSAPLPEGAVLPALEDGPVHVTLQQGIARMPRLILCSRVGNYIGDYLLMFSAPELEAHSIKFAFSTGE